MLFPREFVARTTGHAACQIAEIVHFALIPTPDGHALCTGWEWRCDGEDETGWLRLVFEEREMLCRNGMMALRPVTWCLELGWFQPDTEECGLCGAGLGDIAEGMLILMNEGVAWHELDNFCPVTGGFHYPVEMDDV